MSQILPWRNGLDAPKGPEGDRLLAKNFDTIAQNINKTGLYLVGSARVESAQATTSTSYIDANGLKISVQTNGGLVVVWALVEADITNDWVTARLLDNDKEIDRTIQVGSASFVGRISLLWVGQLEAGQHVFKVQVKTNGGTTLTLNKAVGLNTLAPSQINVLEYLKG